MKTLIQITLTFVFLLATTPAMAQVGDQTPAHDERVKVILEDVNYDWEIDGDGDFRAVLEFTDDRSQVLFVNSNTEMLGNMEVREVWAVAATSRVGFSAEVMQKLLESSATVKLGGWSISSMGDQQLAVFRAKVSANANASALKTSIIAVATTADEMEKELLGTDAL